MLLGVEPCAQKELLHVFQHRILEFRARCYKPFWCAFHWEPLLDPDLRFNISSSRSGNHCPQETHPSFDFESPYFLVHIELFPRSCFPFRVSISQPCCKAWGLKALDTNIHFSQTARDMLSAFISVSWVFCSGWLRRLGPTPIFAHNTIDTSLLNEQHILSGYELFLTNWPAVILCYGTLHSRSTSVKYFTELHHCILVKLIFFAMKWHTSILYLQTRIVPQIQRVSCDSVISLLCHRCCRSTPPYFGISFLICGTTIEL